MKIWKIPVTWKMYGEIEIEADSIENAIKEFDKYEEIEGHVLPPGEYLDDSFERESLEFCKIIMGI